MAANNLFLLVGAPGCGKSTLTRAFARDTLTLSSDSLRAVVGAGELDNDPKVNFIVFKTLENMASYFLARGYDVAIDATNVTRKARKPFVEIAKQFGANIIAYVSEATLEQCKARNAARARVVPEDVIERMHNGMEIPTIGEVDEIRVF